MGRSQRLESEHNQGRNIGWFACAGWGVSSPENLRPDFISANTVHMKSISKQKSKFQRNEYLNSLSTMNSASEYMIYVGVGRRKAFSDI